MKKVYESPMVEAVEFEETIMSIENMFSIGDGEGNDDLGEA